MPVYFPDSYGLVRARDALPDPDGFRSYDAVADYPADAKEMLLSGRKKDEMHDRDTKFSRAFTAACETSASGDS